MPATPLNSSRLSTATSRSSLFFAYIFNTPGKGPLSASLVGFFKGDQVSVKGKSKKAGKMGIAAYAALLQKSLNTELTFPSKPLNDKRMTISAYHDFGGRGRQSFRARPWGLLTFG